MATFKIVNSNKDILTYVAEKAQEEFDANVTQESNSLIIECKDSAVDDILSAYKMAKFKAATGGIVNFSAKKLGTVAGVAKDAGIGGIKIASKGLFGGLKRIAELGIGGTSVIVDEAKASWNELSKSDEVRSIKKSFKSNNNNKVDDEIVMVSNNSQPEVSKETHSEY